MGASGAAMNQGTRKTSHTINKAIASFCDIEHFPPGTAG
jgi:hypothetical protein